MLDNTGSVTTKGFSRAPDVVGRWDKTFDWGAVSLRGVAHELKIDDGAAASASTVGYGLAASGLIKTVDNDSMNWSITGGTGIGRYFNYIEGAFYDAANNKILKEKGDRRGARLSAQAIGNPALQWCARVSAQFQ
ncbi:hypothetical protein ACFS07_08830 [Undibacterium arcticum]